MGVLIDPYMFELSDAQEIKNNVSFFQTIIKLHTQADQDHRGRMILYKGMVDKMRQRSIQPFPINIQTIADSDLRKTIMQINMNFNHMLLRSLDYMADIDVCSGRQEFEIVGDDEMLDDDLYYEMLCILLLPCYSKQTDIDDRILTGRKSRGKQIGDSFQIKCNCFEREYIKKCVFAGVDDLIPAKEKMIKALKEKKGEGGIPVVEVVSAEIGDHHNHVQADRKKFTTLNELSFKNKNVLKLLQEIGLFHIIFGRFSGKGVKEAGTMKIQCVEKNNIMDIVRVKYNSETEMQFITDLYFPKGIGQLVYEYFQNEQMTYQNVSELVEKIR